MQHSFIIINTDCVCNKFIMASHKNKKKNSNPIQQNKIIYQHKEREREREITIGGAVDCGSNGRDETKEEEEVDEGAEGGGYGR